MSRWQLDLSSWLLALKLLALSSFANKQLSSALARIESAAFFSALQIVQLLNCWICGALLGRVDHAGWGV
jgi:hypothetical protein